MKKSSFVVVFLLLLGFSAVGVSAQERQIIPNVMNQNQIDAMVREIARNEDHFRQALTQYVFSRKAKIQTVGLGGLITGTYERDSFMTFTDSGERFERILRAPISTITEISITKEDIDDLGGINPFAINPRDIADYTFSYIGKQRIDELNTHVFDVHPKTLPKDKNDLSKRYFTGRIWVDDEDMMIVKSKGKGIPEGKQRFPVVETWRTNVDGKFWFPAYTAGDDELVFESGQVVRLRMKVTYDDFKLGRSEVIILDDDEPVPDVDQPQPKEPEKKDPNAVPTPPPLPPR